MSLSNYANLKTAVASLLQRSDLTAVIPDFIALAEAELSRVLDCRQMVEVRTLAITGERTPLPCDFAGLKAFRLNNDSQRRFTYISPDQMDDEPIGGSGIPARFTIVGDSFLLSPSPGGSYEARIRYRTRIPALSQVSTNWLLEQHPDAYLYGAAKHSAPHLIEDERLSVWIALFDNAVRQINFDANRQIRASTMQTTSGVCV